MAVPHCPIAFAVFDNRADKAGLTVIHKRKLHHNKLHSKIKSKKRQPHQRLPLFSHILPIFYLNLLFLSVFSTLSRGNPQALITLSTCYPQTVDNCSCLKLRFLPNFPVFVRLLSTIVGILLITLWISRWFYRENHREHVDNCNRITKLSRYATGRLQST